MSVYMGEDPAGRQGANNKGIRTYTRVFKVEATSRTEGPYAIGSTSGLPFIGTAHNEDPDAYCISLTPSCNNPWKGWIVTAEYSSEREMSEQPSDDSAIITWSTEQFQTVVYKDKNGKAVLNSAGDFFADPVPMRDDSRRIVTIEKNLAFVPTWILDTQDAVNASAFEIDGIYITAGQAKIQRVSVGPVENRNTYPFRKVSIEIHLQANGWDLEPLDAGFRQRNTAGELVKITSEGDQTDITTPVPLNGSGAVLADPTPDTSVFGSFEIYDTFEFSNLPLT